MSYGVRRHPFALTTLGEIIDVLNTCRTTAAAADMVRPLAHHPLAVATVGPQAAAADTADLPQAHMAQRPQCVHDSLLRALAEADPPLTPPRRMLAASLLLEGIADHRPALIPSMCLIRCVWDGERCSDTGDLFVVRLWNWFQTVDTDRSNAITAPELGAWCAIVGRAVARRLTGGVLQSEL
jgi:hypothetical protein